MGINVSDFIVANWWIIALVGILGFYASHIVKTEKYIFHRLASRLDASVTHDASFFKKTYSLTGNFQGKKYDADYFIGDQYAPAHFQIMLFSPPETGFYIRVEAASPADGAAARLLHEVEINDGVVDRKYLVPSESEGAVKAFLADAENRADVGSLFGRFNVHRIDFRAGDVTVIIGNPPGPIVKGELLKIVTRERISEILTTLSRLAGA